MMSLIETVTTFKENAASLICTEAVRQFIKFMKGTNVRDVRPSSLVEVYRHFGAIFYLFAVYLSYSSNMKIQVAPSSETSASLYLTKKKGRLLLTLNACSSLKKRNQVTYL
jgi:hypothetical protein